MDPLPFRAAKRRSDGRILAIIETASGVCLRRLVGRYEAGVIVELPAWVSKAFKADVTRCRVIGGADSADVRRITAGFEALIERYGLKQRRYAEGRWYRVHED